MNTDAPPITRTIYRRIYAAWLEGRRINAVSMGAESLFLRLHLTADGYGTYNADPELVAIKCYPRRREVTVQDVEAWHRELIDAGLVNTYETAGEVYGSIAGFEDVQPAGRNGKRHQEHPRNPSGFTSVNPGESRSAQQVRAGEQEQEQEREEEREQEQEGPADPAADNHDDAPPVVLDSCAGTSLGLGLPTDGTGPTGKDATPEPLTRQKARARFTATIAASGMIGREDGATHPTGSPMHAAHLTQLANLFAHVWPEDLADADDEQIRRFDKLTELARAAKTKRTPMAYLNHQVKKQIAEVCL